MIIFQNNLSVFHNIIIPVARNEGVCIIRKSATTIVTRLYVMAVNFRQLIETNYNDYFVLFSNLFKYHKYSDNGGFHHVLFYICCEFY